MLKCLLRIHSWGKWETTETGRIFSVPRYGWWGPFADERERKETGSYYIQKRHCLRCGFTQYKQTELEV